MALKRNYIPRERSLPIHTGITSATTTYRLVRTQTFLVEFCRPTSTSAKIITPLELPQKDL
ncbi:hypothetical protein NG798_00710 [Ancylothrix sp. C2]|uniref:hypothetical protein n=1 Tax=Ancylothrix sp. D3o TaxID=2953691 RepID=UPI0021BB34CA|nr:hypothetical protein [Ancylothrix sp. D3o]MCT7948313.1 hypothetical protein [Ancylothrix sp. D3o]